MRTSLPSTRTAAGSTLAAVLLTLACPFHAQAQVFLPNPILTEPTRTFHVGLDIPDLQDPPLRLEQVIAGSAIAQLTDVRVDLHLIGRGTGGYAGEMYVSLTRGPALTSVLLNRPGSSPSNPAGASYDGWNVRFGSDSGLDDIHAQTPAAGVLTGTYQPDGRIDPLGTDRPASLDVFNSMSPDGAWQLNIADLDLGGLMRIESWSLTFSGIAKPTAVPEPAEWTLVCATALAAVVWIRHGSRKKTPSA